MASADHTLEMREAIVMALRADTGVTALVPAARIYGEQPPGMPAWPFVRVEGFVTSYEQSGCGSPGSEHSITINVFARGPGTNAIARINAAVEQALNDSELDIGALTLIGIDWTGSRIIRDTAEANEYHGIVEFTAQTLGA